MCLFFIDNTASYNLNFMSWLEDFIRSTNTCYEVSSGMLSGISSHMSSRMLLSGMSPRMSSSDFYMTLSKHVVFRYVPSVAHLAFAFAHLWTICYSAFKHNLLYIYIYLLPSHNWHVLMIAGCRGRHSHLIYMLC